MRCARRASRTSTCRRRRIGSGARYGTPGIFGFRIAGEVALGRLKLFNSRVNHSGVRTMGTTRISYSGIAAIIIAVFLTAYQTPLGAQQSDFAIRIGADDLGGTVASANGPEAGVWVIAETNDLPTKFAKIVVTDDRGRFLIPDLPKANYSVWVRGYGL